MLIKNILITGEINSGKTTLINQLIKELNFNVNGFRTLPYFENGKRIGFYIRDLNNNDNTRIETQREQLIGRIIGYKNVKPYNEGFEICGVKFLDDAMNVEGVVLMDELGIIESTAYEFQKKVMNCLDSNRLVICSIRADKSEFLNMVRGHKESIIYTVNKKNRNDILEVIKEDIKNILENEEKANVEKV